MYVIFIARFCNSEEQNTYNILSTNEMKPFKKFANDLRIQTFRAFRENRETITLDYQALLRCKNTSFSQISQLFRQENDICEKYSSDGQTGKTVNSLINKPKSKIQFLANDLTKSSSPKDVLIVKADERQGEVSLDWRTIMAIRSCSCRGDVRMP